MTPPIHILRISRGPSTSDAGTPDQDEQARLVYVRLGYGCVRVCLLRPVGDLRYWEDPPPCPPASTCQAVSAQAAASSHMYMLSPGTRARHRPPPLKAAGEAGAALRLCGNISLRLLPRPYTCTHAVDIGCAHGWCSCMYIGLSESIVVGRRILGLSVPQPGGGVFSPFGSHCRCASAPPQQLVPCHRLAPFPRGRRGRLWWRPNGGARGVVRCHRLAATGPRKVEVPSDQTHTHVFVHPRHPPSCASVAAWYIHRSTSPLSRDRLRHGTHVRLEMYVLLDVSNGNGAPVCGGHTLRGWLPIGPAAVGGTPFEPPTYSMSRMCDPSRELDAYPWSSIADRYPTISCAF